MKFIFRKNQVVISALAVMLAVAGYLTYATDDDTWKSNDSILEISDEDITVEHQVVDINSLDQDASDILASETKVVEDAVLTSGITIADYMAQSKLDREQMRGVTKEALLEIINHDGVTSEEKQTAIDSLVSMNSVVEKENATETLLKSKGFSEVIVSIQENQVDVVVGKESLTDAEVAQIEDIVKRKTEMGVENIIISLVNMDKK